MTAAETPRLAKVAALMLAVAIVPAAALTGLWRWAEAQVPPPPEPVPAAVPATGPPAIELQTSLLSMRRTPGPLAGRAAQAAFDADLAEVLDGLAGSSCAVVTLDDSVRASVRSDVPLDPEDMTTVVLAAVALELLGPDHRFRTEVRAAAPDDDGVVRGDLHLVGGGDPWLSSPSLADDPLGGPVTSLDDLADRVVAAGVQRVEGDVVGVSSRYEDPVALPPGLEEVLPTGALVVDGGRLFGAGIGRNTAQSAASELNRLLSLRGVAITGRNRAGELGSDPLPEVAAVESVDLVTSIGALLDPNDTRDAAAEMLLQEIGFVGAGTGSRAGGADVVIDHLRRWGADVSELVIVDGSGRSPDNRLTCDAVAVVVAQIGPDGALASLLPGPAGYRPARTSDQTFAIAALGAEPASAPVWRRLSSLLTAYPPVIDPESFGPL